jgi:hypothetical protein
LPSDDLAHVTASKVRMIDDNRAVDQTNYDLGPPARTIHEAIQFDEFQWPHQESARSRAVNSLIRQGGGSLSQMLLTPAITGFKRVVFVFCWSIEGDGPARSALFLARVTTS